jgi:pyruvate dehydrogenase E2 component (dihydrolipoamide acetyltransferase)
MGLEVTEGTVTTIYVAAGDHVAEGEALLELETDKALTEVVAPRSGDVLRIEVAVGETVALGQTLIVLGESDGEPDNAAPPAVDEDARVLPTTSAEEEERLELLGATRRTVARRMALSQQIPQFPLTREIDATWLLAEKQRLSQQTPKLSVNDLLMQALAETAVRQRDLAAAYVQDDDGAPPQLRRRPDIDIGLAVATDRGLVVPVLRRVHARRLGELVADRLRLVQAARAGKLLREEMDGATLTLSSLAGFGVDSFAAMLNPGETAILAVGRLVERVVPRDRELAVIPTLTLTIDHRVMDGASGGEALGSLASLLEGAMPWRS